MPYSSFTNVRLAAISAAVPPKSVSLEDELIHYGGDREKARKLIEGGGLSTRRMADEGVTASDLCLQAAEDVLTQTAVNRDDVGALIFVSHSPDYLLPASAALLQGLLGLSNDCATMDMNVGCAGFVKGLWVASGLVASGACDKVLLLVGDTPNRYQDPANRITAPVFGDAGTATLIERDETAGTMSYLLGTNGRKYEALVIPGGGSRIPPDDTPDSLYNQKITDARGNPWTLGGYCRIWMNGLDIYTFSLSVVPPHLKRHLALAKQDADDLSSLLLHQANKVIIKGIAKKVGIPLEKVPFETLAKYGNLGSSSIPALICEHYSDLSPYRTEDKSKVMLCGFGAGLAWASCLLSLEDTKILPVRDYAASGPVPTRDERIAYWHRKFKGDV